MNVNFNGYGENVITFIADSSITAKVAKCSANDVFCGVCVGLRDGYAAVQTSGYVRMPATSKIAVGYKKLVADGSGNVAVNSGGRELLVVDSTATEVGFIL